MRAGGSAWGSVREGDTMTCIEVGRELAAQGKLSFMTDDDAVGVEINEEVTVETHRATETATGEYGVFYQRCGGGRRVIRKHIGSN